MGHTPTAVHELHICDEPATSLLDSAKPIDVIDTACLPEGGKLLLLKCGEDFSIQMGDEELMGNCDHVSEEALATLVAARLQSLDGRILIGGLGMGFTLGAALEAWGPAARIDLVELIPEMIRWANGPLAHLFGAKLNDPRLAMTLADVHDVIAQAHERYDAILLDVDNGPDGFVQAANDRLYSHLGLRSAHAALRPGGMLAVWSAYRDADFSKRLTDADFTIEEMVVPAYVGSISETHCIWLASKHPATFQESASAS